MNDYDKDIELSYLMYLDANNLYGSAMSQKILEDSFKQVEDLSNFNESFIKNYDENNDKGYILEVDVEYPRKLLNLRKDLPFLPKKEKIDKFKKLICRIEDKENYVVHINSLKVALNNGLILKDVHRVTQFNQETVY